MATLDDVTVLVPTYNEAATIGDVIDGFHEKGFENVLVVDGHSSDGTQEIARERGARVVVQTGQGKGEGKGQAVREGLEHVDTEYVLMLDGDGTYRPEDAEAMLEPLFSGEAEHVIGNRFADMESGAMTRLNRLGNGVIDRAYHFIHGQQRMDILSGYRAFTMESVHRMRLEAEGFGIETELAVECAKHGIPTTQVPITYRARPDDSETNLHPVRDGGSILLTLYRLAKTNNPLFYFGSVGTVALLVGVLLGVYVAVEWVTRGVSHEVIAVLGVFAILLGVQLLIFGVLSDMIVSLHREQMRRLEQVTARLDPPGGVGGIGDQPDGRANRETGTAAGPEAGADGEGESEDAEATVPGESG